MNQIFIPIGGRVPVIRQGVLMPHTAPSIVNYYAYLYANPWTLLPEKK